MDRDRLIAEGEGLVRGIALQIHRTLPSHIELDELIAYGRAGLVEAADRFDPRHGAAFNTFAYYRVRGAIYDGLRQMGWMGRAEYAKLRAAERADDYLAQAGEREAARAALPSPGPDDTDPAEALAGTLAGVATVLLASYETETAAEALGGVVSGSPMPRPDAALDRKEDAGSLRRALAELPEKERRMLEMIYFEERSITEAGQALGLSKSWASRLHARAIDLLHAELADRD